MEKDPIRAVIESWEKAIRRGDMEGILAHHVDDILMFDVPEPLIERRPRPLLCRRHPRWS